ncbi:FAD/NAD(P)-binding domain-containing protein [Aspergillus sclerotioniger CBS 115572]|uniref:FAD/NAD(P)-binding domain-containing protein n=1 Tax=Aspergillus sclerotioniger CBS 115572 TaxID=1450535 RepID=A0A317XBY6_9EURO|nr:FAD/NAD(P)-binding domain-containing protein [Aspergillus sclerotioniger CBS 115572]PWY96106.1 FAD/NAD(P)-binding domain-containing protein [Aspergillus sclerotioniger CBS 115572]
MGSSLSSVSDSPTESIVIVGAGASGIAVLLRLIDHAKDGKRIPPIIVVEKSSPPGPGLAYSPACTGTIINMHTDTMGLSYNDPKHFTRWRDELESGPFPSRSSYGEYLEAMWSQILSEAQKLGLSISIIQDEVSDIDRHDNGTFTLTFGGGNNLPARSVILALGNFTSTLNTHLIDRPGFFPSPWPTSQLTAIPTDASVLIIGSRLSAVDAALFLSKNGHQGSMTFMSRSGRLPKVQGDPEPYPRRYTLHTLARDIESNPADALVRLTTRLMDEIDGVNHGDWTWLQKHASPLAELQADLHAAKAGNAHWQTVLRHTAPVIERYWRCLSLESQKLFMAKFLSPWMRYRHGMPVQNAQKILDLLQTSQLSVVAGEAIHWDEEEGIFVAQTTTGMIEAPYVIEATGQESDLDRIPSPLIQSAVRKGLFTPHPMGGVDVSFDTLRASAPGLYTMGSLTRGTHFYVSAIDRVAAHAARIADALVGEPPVKSLQIAIFLGADLASHLTASELVPRLLAEGHMPFLFLTSSNPTTPAGGYDTRPFELRELEFFESELFRKHLCLKLKDQAVKGARHATVEQMQAAYGILVQEVPSLKQAAILDTLQRNYIDVGILLQCSEKLEKDVTNYFSSASRPLLALDSGILQTSWAGKDTGIQFGYCMRTVEENGVLGDMFETRASPIGDSRAIPSCVDGAYEVGVQVAFDKIKLLSRGRELRSGPLHGAEDTKYLTKDQLFRHARSRGVPLVDGDRVVEVLVESFAPPQKKGELRKELDEVVREWYAKENVGEQE